MKTTLSKVLLGRLIIEALVLLVAFVAVDEMTAPSESTATALLEAVNQKQIEPIALVEVSSAIRSASTMNLVLWIMRLLAVLLLVSDLWLLWQSRKAAKTTAE